MAKIIKSSLHSILDVIIVGDKKDDITVDCEIWFHPTDIRLEIEYLLQVFVYDTRGGIDIPVIIPNWDLTKIASIANGGKDDYLGAAQIKVQPTEELSTVSLSIALQLGVLTTSHNYSSRHLRAFVSLLPCTGRSVQWTKELNVDVLH